MPTVDYPFPGGPHEFKVPPGVTEVTVDLRGAKGGHLGREGLGGRVVCTLPVTPGETLQVLVGAQGISGSGNQPGGFNGGGASRAGPGGGATDVRRGAFALEDRIAVAGGGGGGPSAVGTPTSVGGDGGGLIGESGTGISTGGAGGTQVAGGSPNGTFGQGGNNFAVNSRGGGGGGGGWHGGGSGQSSNEDTTASGGGGGSSYTDPAATNVVHTQGYQDGNGSASISWEGSAAHLTETRGFPFSPTPPATSSAYSGMQTTMMFVPADIVIKSFRWMLSQLGTYEIRIDGELIISQVVTTGGQVTFTPPSEIPLEAGIHELKLRKVSGNNGWYYGTGRTSWVDSWLHMTYWIEAGGNEIVPVQIVGRIMSNAYRHLEAGGTLASSPTTRTNMRWAQTFVSDQTVLAVEIGSTAQIGHRVRVNGVIVGTSPIMAAAGGAAVSQSPMWIPFDTPMLFEAGVTYEVQVERVDGGSITGAVYDTAGVDYVDDVQTVGVLPATSGTTERWWVSWDVVGPPDDVPPPGPLTPAYYLGTTPVDVYLGDAPVDIWKG